MFEDNKQQNSGAPQSGEPQQRQAASPGAPAPSWPPSGGTTPPRPSAPVASPPSQSGDAGGFSPQSVPMQGSLSGAPIHTMPEKFMGSGARPSTSGKPGASSSGKKLLAIIAVVALVLAGVTGGVYWYLNSGSPAPLPEPVNQVPDQPAVQNTNAQPPVETVALDQEARLRDEQRIDDVILIARALDDYFERFDAYPQLLSLIPGDIIPTVPRDPSTNVAYSYALLPGRVSYEIIFDIESQAVFKDETLTKGTYRMSPEDFDTEGGAEPPADPVADDGGAQPAPPNLDADGDGLTTLEERIFRTSPVSDDTDADGYPDETEIMNFYSPVESGPVKLDTAGFVSSYTNDLYGFSLFYPSRWVFTADPDESSEVLITTDTGENFEISILPNTESLTSWEWYVQNVSGDLNPSSVDIVTIGDVESVRTLDGLEVYIAVDDLMISFVYDLNAVTTINYLSIFDFMLRHLTIAPTT